MANDKSKYNNRPAKRADRNEKLGIILSVIAVFFLFCLLTRSLVLGVIGEFIYRILFGLFGCLAYPLSLVMLVSGIAKAQNVKLVLRRRYIVVASIVAIAVVEIVQIATDLSAMLSLNFGDYLSACYFSEFTAGGLVFGLISYPSVILLGEIGAYVVYGALILLSLLSISSFVLKFTQGVKQAKFKNKIKTNSTVSAVCGENRGLFIEDIKKTKSYENNSQTIEEVVDEEEPIVEDKTTESFSTTKNYYNEYSEIDEYNRTKTEEFWQNLNTRKSIHRALFEENVEAYSKYKPQKQKVETKVEPVIDQPQVTQSYGFTGHYPEKDVRNSYVAGAIINGDEISRQIEKERSFLAQKQKNIEEAESTLNSIENTQPAPIKEVFDFSKLPPITNGDRYETENSTVSKEVERSYKALLPENALKETKLEQKEEIVEEITVKEQSPYAQTPIINADTYKSFDEYEESDRIYIEGVTAPIENSTNDDIEEKQQPIIELNDSSDDKVEESFEEENSAQFVVSSQEESDNCDDYLELTEEQALRLERLQNAFNKQQEEKLLATNGFESTQEEIIEDNFEEEIEDEIVEEEEESLADFIEEEEFEQVESEEEILDDVVESENVEEGNEEESIDGEKVYDPSMFDDECFDDEKVEISDSLPSDEELEQIRANERAESFVNNTESFNIIEEVEDLSENSNQSSEAINAYYSQMVHRPDEEEVLKEYVPPVPNISVKKDKTEKNGALANQIDMDTYVEKVAKEQVEPAKPQKVLRDYSFPPLSLMTSESTPLVVDEDESREKIEILEACLESLGIPAKVIGITKGPAVTRYELDMPPGMRVNKIEQVSSDIKYSLACAGEIRIQTPIPGKRAVGIEVPNDKVAIVGLKDIIDSDEFRNSPSPVTVSLGKDISGKVIITRLDKLPHLLIAGTTGSGKSACLNSLIISLLYKASPQDVKIILVDPKRVEFVTYNGIPHMLIPNAITDVNQAIKALTWCKDEMNRRFSVLGSKRCKNIDEYRALPEVKDGTCEKMPYIVFIVDEYADLMLSSGGSDKKKALESQIMSIAGKARAAGIHLVLATQRPSQDVVTGTLKANLPSKICFKVTNKINSQVVIDRVGAESLVGRGDMLFINSTNPEPTRVQGAFIDTDEVVAITDYVRENNDTDFSDEFKNAISEPVPEEKPIQSDGEDEDGESGGGYDKDLETVARLVMKLGSVSASMIQRRFSMGYVRATRIVDQMEELGFISPLSASNRREILLTPEKFEGFFGKSPDED